MMEQHARTKPRTGRPRAPVAAATAISVVLLVFTSCCCCSTARAAEDATTTPSDVQERWAQLDTTKWSFAKLQDAVPLLTAPPGFDVSVYYKGGLVPGARSLALSEAKPGNGSGSGGPVITYVSTRLNNVTYALVDETGDGSADYMTVVLDNIDTPQGIAWHE
jgi:hypothetical protein